MSWKYLLTVASAVLVLSLALDYNGALWQSYPAATKLNILWTACEKDRQPGTFPGLGILNLFLFSTATSFDTIADDMPFQGFMHMFRRRKLIHSVGAIAQMKWISTGNHPYTGGFRGSNYSLLRFSYAAAVDLKDPYPHKPGLSFKFLRSGMKSANLFGMVNLKGQESSNFFEHDLTNHVPDLIPSTAAENAVLSAFRKASQWPTLLGVSDFARFNEDGTEVAEPKFPFRLIYHPTKEAKARFAHIPDASDLPSMMSKIPPGPLYEIWAEPEPNARAVKIADVILTTSPISSRFSDESLFFQHQRIDDDFAYRPEWKGLAEAISAKQRKIPYYLYPDVQDSN